MLQSAIQLETSDGIMPVQVFEPGAPQRKGGVIFYMDAFGIRPELMDMCRRFSDAGYVACLPDLYYRLGPQVRFPVPASAAGPYDPEMANANVATTVEMTVADTSTLVSRIIGTAACGVSRFGAVGYCMGARHALGAAALLPDTVKAAACLHGGRMVWEGENSPHNYIRGLEGSAYFAFASNDETCPANHQALIETTITESGARAETEYFAAPHGWTFPSRWCYDHSAAERAHARVLSLFARAMPPAAGNAVPEGQ